MIRPLAEFLHRFINYWHFILNKQIAETVLISIQEKSRYKQLKVAGN